MPFFRIYGVGPSWNSLALALIRLRCLRGLHLGGRRRQRCCRRSSDGFSISLLRCNSLLPVTLRSLIDGWRRILNSSDIGSNWISRCHLADRPSHHKPRCCLFRLPLLPCLAVRNRLSAGGRWRRVRHCLGKNRLGSEVWPVQAALVQLVQVWVVAGVEPSLNVWLPTYPKCNTETGYSPLPE